MTKRIKRQISREQWRELDNMIKIDWVKHFEIRDIWKALPDIGQIMDYLEGEWLPHREEIFGGKGEPIDKLWALLILNRNQNGKKN